MTATVHQQDIELPRGARFRAHAWVVLDDNRQPMRSAGGLTVVSKVRRFAGDDRVLHEFVCSAVMLTLPGQYDDQPVAIAQINEMTRAQTAALTWDRGVYDVLADDWLVAGGAIAAPMVVSR